MGDGQAILETRRRNGKPWSCESCRRAKVSCDHKSPCSRCVKRNKADSCIYHPAPLTKPRTSPGPSGGVQRRHTPSSHLTRRAPHSDRSSVDAQRTGLASPSSSDTQPQPNKSHYPAIDHAAPSRSDLLSPMEPPSAPLHLSPDEQSSRSASIANPEVPASFRESRTGFLGPTSYHAVYTENPTMLDLQAIEETPCPLTLSPEKIQQGVEVLRTLRDIPTYQKLLSRWATHEGIVVPQPIFQEWIDCLWEVWGAVLIEGDPDTLRSLCRLIWDNTQKPMKVSGDMTALAWAAQASGRNLRWETIAAILSVVGLVAINLSDWDAIIDPIRERDKDRSTFAERMRRASETGLCAAYECETALNETYCSAVFLDLVLVGCLKGDAHYAAWQRTGEFLDCVVAMGMHRGNRADSNTPFFLAELRNRLFHMAYSHDKMLASYLGRPPRCSQRFCRFNLPLDLSDRQLCAPDVTPFLTQLDENGWNTRGSLHRMTWLRVMFQHMRVLEDILEVALSPAAHQPEREIRQQVEQIRGQLGQLNASYPHFMRSAPEAMLACEITRSLDGLFLLCVHCSITNMEFLLERALINRLRTSGTVSDSRPLLQVSRKMLRLVLLAQAKRELFRDFQSDHTFLLAFYGLTSAANLLISLYQEEQARHNPAVGPPSGLLPRTEIIPEISVFIAALAMVHPGDGNFAVCDQGRRALKRVLDQILAPPPVLAPLPPPPQMLATGGGGGEGGLAGGGTGGGTLNDSALFFSAGNDADFLNWLDTVDWDRTSLMGGGDVLHTTTTTLPPAGPMADAHHAGPNPAGMQQQLGAVGRVDSLDRFSG